MSADRITTALAEIKDAESKRKSYESGDGPSCAKCFQSVSVEPEAEFNPGDFCTACTYEALDASRETIGRLVSALEFAVIICENVDAIHKTKSLKAIADKLTGDKP